MDVEWTHKGEIINDIGKMPEGVFGFIYIVRTEKGHYIGKKQVVSVRKRKFGKREIARMENKRLKKWEFATKENKWRDYTGSNEELNKLISEGLEYTKEILYYGMSKASLTYLETRELWTAKVLEDRNCFNSNISGRHFNQYK